MDNILTEIVEVDLATKEKVPFQVKKRKKRGSVNNRHEYTGTITNFFKNEIISYIKDRIVQNGGWQDGDFESNIASVLSYFEEYLLEKENEISHSKDEIRVEFLNSFFSIKLYEGNQLKDPKTGKSSIVEPKTQIRLLTDRKPFQKKDS